MEKQIKLLDKQYLETRLREIKDIKAKEVTFDFENSDRPYSKTLYIQFYIKAKDGIDYKVHTLRISDHSQKGCVHTQFLIDPNDFLSKKKKALFMRTIEGCIKKGQKRFFYMEMEKISKGLS